MNKMTKLGEDEKVEFGLALEVLFGGVRLEPTLNFLLLLLAVE